MLHSKADDIIALHQLDRELGGDSSCGAQLGSQTFFLLC